MRSGHCFELPVHDRCRKYCSVPYPHFIDLSVERLVPIDKIEPASDANRGSDRCIYSARIRTDIVPVHETLQRGPVECHRDMMPVVIIPLMNDLDIPCGRLDTEDHPFRLSHLQTGGEDPPIIGDHAPFVHDAIIIKRRTDLHPCLHGETGCGQRRIGRDSDITLRCSIER